MATAIEMPPVQLNQKAPNPRKRKKRAPAAGAAVDCFKCAERNIKCDRRRPYCSQCLDVGQDCSGYKTQLTWGVGVASRGKLRGLSLPIAGTHKVPPTILPPKAKKRKESNAETPQIYENGINIVQELAPQYTVSQVPTAVPTRTSSESTSPVTSAAQGGTWDPNLFSGPRETHYTNFDRSICQTQTTTSELYSINTTLSNGYATSPLHTPVSFRSNIWDPQSSHATPYLGPNGSVTPGASSNHMTPTTAFDRSNSFSTNNELVSPAQLSIPESSMRPDHLYDGISMLLKADRSMQPPKREAIFEQAKEELERIPYDECAISDELSILPVSSPFDFDFCMPMLSGISNIGKTSRMQYLINYYSEVISPVIVAFDSPSNPFRNQILRLAESNETLQHAISALAASNLRQRRGIGLLSTGKTLPARRSSFAHVHLSGEYAQSLLSDEEQMREEALHKRLAVSQLNQQLAHPMLRKDDSILATLLILCLFHICDSGIAKFRTQFAGVRKLLALRGSNTKIGSEDSRWMSRLFTWFDTLAATVNDREGQINGPFLETSALCGDWALENMVGIDAQLFRSISKLGRLNLLRQGKIVTEKSTIGPMPPMPFSSSTSPFIDGNGWARHDSGVGFDITESESCNSKQFWQEWNDVRNELLSWSLDTTLFDSISRESSYLTVDQRADMENISQSFRYSALIYLERLARPHIASSDEAIQRWVRQSLSHINKVVSDVYLLWPLFITGTECVHEESRQLVASRMADIQKDSGFVNNASCLQLLEKVWHANSPASSPKSDGESQSCGSASSDNSTNSVFMFRDVMMKEAARTEGEGEYIVV